MNVEKHLERDVRDFKITEQCERCCLSCEKYTTVKEQNAKCEVRKARGRITARMIMRAKIEEQKIMQALPVNNVDVNVDVSDLAEKCRRIANDMVGVR